ncbi:MAG: glycerophosphodiester phosphodiesterase [Paraglaciecola sp.]|nr:glycerophosphodiester phosphodiesterase [Paraglaciecola sp.]NCT49587.1 glycerophosphodiester phosphodiesterase [Paraglaciecola sp.]
MQKYLISLGFSLLIVGSALAKPLVIAHRGASGYLPEHTLEAVTLAFALGADFIEQDLVLTKDLVPVVLHDIHLDTVTNVAELYPNRKRDDGRYYALDFTLAELKTLRVHERRELNGQQVFASRFQGNADFKIATFAEELELIAQLNRQFKRNVGYYPEIKSPKWHRDQGVDISAIVLNILRDYQLDDAEKAIFVQCFDFAETKRLRSELGAKVKLIQLIGENDWLESGTDYNQLQTPAGLSELAEYVQGIGPWLPQIFDITTQQATGLVANAHQRGLAVHPYTFRLDALPEGITSEQMLRIVFEQLIIDGLFTDFTDTVVDYLGDKQTQKNPE